VKYISFKQNYEPSEMSLFTQVKREHEKLFDDHLKSSIECARNIIHSTTESTFRNFAMLASFAVIDVFTFALWFKNGVINLIRS